MTVPPWKQLEPMLVKLCRRYDACGDIPQRLRPDQLFPPGQNVCLAVVSRRDEPGGGIFFFETIGAYDGDQLVDCYTVPHSQREHIYAQLIAAGWHTVDKHELEYGDFVDCWYPPASTCLSCKHLLRCTMEGRVNGSTTPDSGAA